MRRCVMDLSEYVGRADEPTLLELREMIETEMAGRKRPDALEAARLRRVAQMLPVGTVVGVLTEHEPEYLRLTEIEAVIPPPRGPQVELFFSPRMPSMFLSVEAAWQALREDWRLEVQVGNTGYRLMPAESE